jgi:signal transduction histidine kinase
MSTGQVEQLTQLSLQPGAHVETSTGAGLGLAIAYRLATLLAATLSVSSQPASGNCFTLRLPQQLDVTTAEKQAG